MEDIIIVGAGPAGLTAAIYVQRAGKHAIIYEKGVPGGQIIKTPNIQNYPSIKSISGADFAENLYQQAISLGAEVRFESVIGLKIVGKDRFVITENGPVQAKAIILATGTSSRKLGIKNEDKFVGKGLSYCATCDGMFFKNKSVAVVGGGNIAITDALFLSNYCKKVYLVAKGELTADSETIKKLSGKNNVEIITNASVTKLLGTEKLDAIDVSKKDGIATKLDVSGLFVAIGQDPANSEFKDVIKSNNFGFIDAGEDCKTNVPGVFVAGDNRTKKVRQLTTACSDGTVAALSAIDYIK